MQTLAKVSRLFGVSTLLASCATPTAPAATDPAGRARQRIERLTASGELPGIQYRVLGPDGVIFAAAAGVRDVSSGQPMEDSTVQMAYSTTKAITAIAVMQLVERGKMDLDAPLTRYYAEHPYGDGITVRMLLAQTAGIPNPAPLDWFVVGGAPFDRDQKLRQVLFANPRLKRAPGQAYGYSNLSYWLLEKAIEKASGQDYGDYVAENIFRPVGVAPESAHFALDGPEALAVGHAPRFSPMTLVLKMMTPRDYWLETHGRWSRSARVLPYGRAYGGLFATAGALGAVLQDLLRDNSRLLGRTARAALFSRQYTTAGKPIDGALGWVIGEVDGARYLGKQGGGLGFHGNLRIYPEQRIATVLLANRTEVSAGSIDARSDALDKIFLRDRMP